MRGPYSTPITPLTGSLFHADPQVWGERRYQVARVRGNEVTFRPELREAVEAGAAVHFHNPGCVMRLANPDDFFDPIRSGRFSYLNPVFVEAAPDAS